MNTHVDFENVKLLKEKGYDNETSYYYDELGALRYDSDFPSLQPTKYKLYYDAPTIADVVMWSFSTHKIWITVDVNINGKFNYLLRQFNSKDKAWEVKNPSSIQEYFNNPDDAYSSGITYFLNNLEMSK